jgi:creatinine amidohydrolase
LESTLSPLRFRYWHDLNARQIADLAARAVVILPIAATEQHGPHLATGTDTIIGNAILDALHRTPPAAGEFLRLPTLAVGASDHHMSFGGTLSLPAILFCQVLVAQLRCLAQQGHRRILIFNSHGGNIAPMQTALAELAGELHEKHIVAAALSYWQLARQSWSELPPLAGRSLSHACEFETSMVYCARPDLERVPPPRQRELHDSMEERCSLALPFAATTDDGAFGDPRLASPELGLQLITRAADALRAFLSDFSTYSPSPQ